MAISFTNCLRAFCSPEHCFWGCSTVSGKDLRMLVGRVFSAPGLFLGGYIVLYFM
jgi:hypothetical protein